MPSRVTCKSSSLCLDCLCASLYCLCFSWALWSACWILPLALHLVSFQLCLPGEISAVLVTSNFFLAPQLKFKAAEDGAMTICFLPLMLGTLRPCQCIDRLICILGVSRQASEEECWLTQMIIDFLKWFLENIIQEMWLVWARQSFIELAPWINWTVFVPFLVWNF